MSPVARLGTLAAVVISLPFLPPAALAALSLTLAAVLAVAPGPLRRAALTGIVRVRWLLLAVFAFYVVFTPQPDWLEATARTAVLVCAVAAVQLALHGMAPATLADALARLLAPLRRVGVPADAFSRRLALTLDAVPTLQALIAATPAAAGGTPLARLADRAAAVVGNIESLGASVSIRGQRAAPTRAAPTRAAPSKDN